MNLAALASLIGGMPGYDANTPTTDVVAWLRTETPTPMPSRFVTALTILSELPLLADSILGKLRAAAMQSESVFWAVEALKSGGLDVCDPVTQARIEVLTQTSPPLFTEDEAIALRGMGMQMVSRWTSIGGNDSDADGYIEQVIASVRGWV